MAEPGATAPAAIRLRPWQRLSVRLAVLFAVVTLAAVAAAGFLVHERQKRDLEETVGSQLMNIARTGALLVDPALHAEVQRTGQADSDAYRRLREQLARMQIEILVPSAITTLADFDPATGRAKVIVSSEEGTAPGTPQSFPPPVTERLGWCFEDGVARFTPLYRTASGAWITAFAPIMDASGKTLAVLHVDYPVELYLDRLNDLQRTVWLATLGGGAVALVLGLLFARGVTRPVSALTDGVNRVAGGDLSQALPVRSGDELGQLTGAFNHMVEGLRQRDFIRATFGRYVSPEVARKLLESPDALGFGGEKRRVTVLMSDMRGYTRFAEQGAPETVITILNAYLGRMTDIVIEHGGTINEFIGDAIFAIWNAPLEHADHPERACAAALAMQRAMNEINREHEARGLPRFEMGIGVNTGEVVVGNIGSEQRAKYAVVGAAVNLAARIEGATVGGQVFVSAATYEAIRPIAEVAPPVAVEMKGIAEPVLLYELRAIGGAFPQRLPDDSREADAAVEVALPLTASVIEGKVVSAETIPGTVVRLGLRRLEARVGTRLKPLTNLRFRLNYPGLGFESGDIYGKVVGEEAADGQPRVRIHITAVDPADQKILEQFLE